MPDVYRFRHVAEGVYEPDQSPMLPDPASSLPARQGGHVEEMRRLEATIAELQSRLEAVERMVLFRDLQVAAIH